MRKEIVYKLQGDGRDSWSIKEFDNEDNMTSAYMVYIDPEIKPTPIVNVVGIIQNLSTEELTQLKQLLNN